jgi:hypothetical protein
MKGLKTIFQISCVVLVILISACESERRLFSGPYFVRFTSEEETQRESFSKVINIEVHLAGPAHAEDVVVHYFVTGDAREGVDYVILGDEGTVVIPAGKYVGNIQVQLINNSNNILRSQQVIFHLESTDDSDIAVGQSEGGIGKTFELTIFDDCILGGNYKGQRSAFSIPVEGITITSEDCENYLLSNWNIDFFNTPFEIDLTFVDNGDNTLTIPDQEEDLFSSDFATIRGSGTVNPITREIEFTVILVDFEEQPELTFKLIPD